MSFPANCHRLLVVSIPGKVKKGREREREREREKRKKERERERGKKMKRIRSWWPVETKCSNEIFCSDSDTV